MITLTILIPCYNEGPILSATCQRLRTYLEEANWQGNQPKTWEILFVNDGSKDDTDAIVSAIAARDPRVRLCSYPHNGGQGKALQTGFAAARGQWIFCVDADLDYGPEHIERFLHEALAQQADLIVGSPYMAGGRSENVPRVRLWMSKAINRYFSFVFNIPVATFTGIVRLYRRSALSTILLTSRDKDILPEIIIKAHALGLKIIEAPAQLCWKADVQKSRGRGIGVVTTAKKAFRHLLWGVVENPGLFFSVPIVISILGLLWFTGAVTHILIRHSALTDAGLIVDITNTLSRGVHTSPHTFFIWFLFFFTTMILTSIGLIIYQNKAKKDQDYICFTHLAQLIRNRDVNDVTNRRAA
jgi:glycosyltransferase involved in cell wall biosynthesis